MHKFEPTTLPALFMGWHLLPGMSFKGDYLVCALQDFNDKSLRRVPMHRIKRVVKAKELQFPLKQAYDQDRVTIHEPLSDMVDVPEIADEAAPLKSPFDIPPGFSVPHDWRPPAGVEVPPTIYLDDGGRNARSYAGSLRPFHVWPEVWYCMKEDKK